MLLFPVRGFPFELDVLFFGKGHFLPGKRRAVRIGFRSSIGGRGGLKCKGSHVFIYTAFTEKLQPVFGGGKWGLDGLDEYLLLRCLNIL